MSRWIRSESSPFGPLTVTRSGSIAIVTPAGTGIGCFPIRDMVRLWGLPDPRHDLTADALAASVVSGHDSSGGRDDGRAHAALDAGHVGVVDVDATARTRDALDAGDDRLALLGVLQRHGQLLAGAPARGRMHLVAVDVALLLEDAGDLALELRGGQRD